MAGYPWNPLPPVGDGKIPKPAGPDDIPFRKGERYVVVPKGKRKGY